MPRAVVFVMALVNLYASQSDQIEQKMMLYGVIDLLFLMTCVFISG